MKDSGTGKRGSQTKANKKTTQARGPTASSRRASAATRATSARSCGPSCATARRPEILTQGAPHLGTDGLIGILKSLREQLTDLGVDLRFGTRLLGLETENNECVGVRVLGAGGEATLKADAVVCAAGHSADDVYDALEAAGAKLEAKPVAPVGTCFSAWARRRRRRHDRPAPREQKQGRLPRRAPPISGEWPRVRRPRLPRRHGQC